MRRQTGLLFAAALVTACASGSGSSGNSDDLDASSGDAAAVSDDASVECAGRANGSPCGVADDSSCDRADICVDGACVENFAAAGTPCGDQADTECSAPDACDGAGRCAPHHLSADTPCGDPATTTCSAPDACDGDGACASHDAADGTSCEDCEEGPGWCASCALGVCSNLCGDATDVTTSFTGTNGLDGSMFDLVTRSDVRVTGFDVHLGPGVHNVSVYAKAGTYVGFGQAPDAWTLLGGTAVTSEGSGTVTPLPIELDYFVASGERVAFYVTTDGSLMRYSNAPADGAVGDVYAATDELDLLLGAGNGTGFGTVNEPRGFDGRVYYRACQ